MTILYNYVERLLNAGRLPTFQQWKLRDVRFNILTVACRLTTTSQIIELNFAMDESDRFNETMRADYEEFSNLQEAFHNSLSIDSDRSAFCVGYTVASWIQRMLMILIGNLEAGQAFYGE